LYPLIAPDHLQRHILQAAFTAFIGAIIYAGIRHKSNKKKEFSGFFCTTMREKWGKKPIISSFRNKFITGPNSIDDLCAKVFVVYQAVQTQQLGCYKKSYNRWDNY